MADTDKLVKVGQLDSVADAVIEVISDTNERLGNLKSDLDNGYVQFTADDFIQGAWERSGTGNTSARNIRIANGCPVKAGDILATEASNLWICWHVMDDENNILEEYYRTSSYYKYQITDRKYTFTTTGTLYITVANGTNYGNSTNIVPSDMTAVIRLYSSYYAKTLSEHEEKFSKIDYALTGVEHFPSQRFSIGGLVGFNYQEPTYWTYQRRVTTPSALNYDRDLVVNIESGYRFGVTYMNGETAVDSGWKTSAFTVPANKDFKVTIGRVPEAQTDPVLTNDDIDIFVNKVYFSTVLGERVDTLEEQILASKPYSAPEGFVDVKRYSFDVVDTNIKPTYPTSVSVGNASSYQGLAVYGNIAVQLYSDDAAVLVDLSTGSVVAELSIECGHGNNINFSNEFYDSADEFPLAYITSASGGDDNIIKIIRITRSGCTTIRTIKIPGSTSCWYGEGILDPLNNVLYVLGYKVYSYREERDGANKIVVAKYNLSSMTTNEDETVTPDKVDSFEVPFYTTSQGAILFDGKIMLLSSHYSDTHTKIVIIDPTAKRICAVVDDFPSYIASKETEGIAVVEDGANYAFLLKTNTDTNFYKMVF